MAGIMLVIGLWLGAAQNYSPSVMTVEYEKSTTDVPFTTNMVVDQYTIENVYFHEPKFWW